MKKISVFLLTALMLIISAFFVACQGEKIKYQLTFKSGGEIVSIVRLENLEDVQIPDDPIRGHYVFDGWFWDEGKWEKPFTVNSILDKPVSVQMDMTVYAKWKGEEVAIAYECDGERTKTVEYGTDFSLPVPDNGERGYIFVGWEISLENGGFQLITGNDGKSLYPCDFTDCTAKAVWSKEQAVRIAFDGDGAEGEMEEFRSEETTFTLPQNTFTKKDQTFVGWLCDGKLYADGETVSLQHGWYTFKAVWNNVKVTFDGNGGEGEMVDLLVGNTAFALPKNTFVRPGYIFIGWQCGEETYADGATVSLAYGEYIFIAKWKGVKYTVSFDGGEQGEGSMLDQVVENGAGQKLSLNTFTRVGYNFDGWETADGKKYADGAEADFTAKQGDTVRLTAQWSPITYYVYIKPDAETPNEECEVWKIRYDKDSLISTAQLYYKTGYKHIGWKQINGAGAGTEWDFNTYVFNLASEEGACIEFIPVWTPIEYQIKYRYFNGTNTPIREIVDLSYEEEHTVIDSTGVEREGYVFAGWQFSFVFGITKEYEGKIVQPGDTVKRVAEREKTEIELIAVWKALSYNLRVHIGDDADTILEYTKTYKESLSIPLEGIQTKKGNRVLEGFRVGHKGIAITWSDKENRIPFQIRLTSDYCTEQNGTVDAYPLWGYTYQGSGTSDDPYIVDCADAMEGMAVAVFIKHGFGNYREDVRPSVETYFSFTQDIDMTGRDFTPIGLYRSPEIRGGIYGNGHTVYALNMVIPEDIRDASEVGFVCANRGTIRDLRFVNGKLSVKADVEQIDVGFITASMYQSSVEEIVLENCAINVENTGKVNAAPFQTDGCYGHELLKKVTFSGTISVKAGGDVKVGAISVGNGTMLACAAQAEIQVVTSGKATLYGVGTSEKKKCVYTIFKANIQASELRVSEAGSDYSSNTVEKIYYSDASSVTFNQEGYVLNEAFKTADANLKNPAWIAEHLPAMRTAEWTMEKGYPQLGERTLERVEITSKEQFLALAGKNLTEQYVLACDIDMSGVAWSMPSVYGEFDGNGHTVSNYAVSDFKATSIGLFAYNLGTIKNLAVENVQLLAMATGNNVYLAGLVIENEGEIAYCKVSGSLLAEIQDASVYVGGIAAINNGGRIYCSYTDCVLEGTSSTDGDLITAYVFGIAYNLGGSIEHCYTAGEFTAKTIKEDTFGYVSYLYMGGVSNEAENCFSLANLSYVCADKKSVWAVASSLEACSSQTINGTAQSGISEAFLKNEGYLLQSFGWKKFVDKEQLKTDIYSAWSFSADAFPALYFE